MHGLQIPAMRGGHLHEQGGEAHSQGTPKPSAFAVCGLSSKRRHLSERWAGLRYSAVQITQEGEQLRGATAIGAFVARGLDGAQSNLSEPSYEF
jgi:hypothetical protein